jgi:predicted DNA-binding transcriptional regulator YafY
MRKAERLFQLTNLIRHRQPITAQTLADELEISVRSVYRYIDDLSVSGIPIYGTTGIGYQLDDHFELPPLNLTENELEALLLGVNMVRGWTSDELSQSAKSLAVKIEVAVPKALNDGLLTTIHVPHETDRSLEREKWQQIHQAIKKQTALFIDYSDQYQQISQRQVYPLGLFYWGGKWTLGCWCTLRKGYRDFRLDRMQQITQLPRFEKTAMINFDVYIASFDDKK